MPRQRLSLLVLLAVTTTATPLAAVGSSGASGDPENIIRVPLAPIAETLNDPTIGIVNDTSYAGMPRAVFFVPLSPETPPSRTVTLFRSDSIQKPWTQRVQTIHRNDSLRIMGLGSGFDAAMPVTVSLPKSGRYMIGLLPSYTCNYATTRAFVDRHPQCQLDEEFLKPAHRCWWRNASDEGSWFQDGRSCSFDSSGCPSFFYVCTSDPRGQPVNPASSASLDSCYSHDTPARTFNWNRRGQIKHFEAGSATVYLAPKAAVHGHDDVRYKGSVCSLAVEMIFIHEDSADFWDLQEGVLDVAHLLILLGTVAGTLLLGGAHSHVSGRRQQRYWREELARSTIVVHDRSRGLSNAFRARANVRGRIRACLHTAGLLLLAFGLAPFIHDFMRRTANVPGMSRVFMMRETFDRFFDDIKLPINYWREAWALWLTLIAPGVMLTLLSVAPTDRRTIRFMLKAFSFLFIAVGSISFGLVHWGRHREVILGCTVGVAMVLGAAVLFVEACKHDRPARLSLLRLWLTIRSVFFWLGCMFILDQGLGVHNAYEWARNDPARDPDWWLDIPWMTSYVASGASFIVFALFSTHRNRSRVLAALSHMSRSSHPERRAAMIASVLGEAPPSITTALARRKFLSIPCDRLEPQVFMSEGGVNAHTSKSDKHKAEQHTATHFVYAGQLLDAVFRRMFPQTEPNNTVSWAPSGTSGASGSNGDDIPDANTTSGTESEDTPVRQAFARMRNHAVETRLGECDAFISHAHDDEVSHPGESFEVLQRWAAAQSTMPKVWIDRICLDVDAPNRSLPLLPLFVTGSAHMLVIAGAAISSRLWVAIEIFTFIETGGTPDQLVVLPIGDSRREDLFATFDTFQAKCTRAYDRELLIAIIETSFGDARSFNMVMRKLIVTGPPERARSSDA